MWAQKWMSHRTKVRYQSIGRQSIKFAERVRSHNLSATTSRVRSATGTDAHAERYCPQKPVATHG